MARNGMPGLISELAGTSTEAQSIRIERRLRTEPRCPVAHYLAGCAAFDEGKTALGARHMMICHHVDSSLESAALLAFCGLTWSLRGSTPMLRVLLDTWQEFRRPE